MAPRRRAMGMDGWKVDPGRNEGSTNCKCRIAGANVIVRADVAVIEPARTKEPRENCAGDRRSVQEASTKRETVEIVFPISIAIAALTGTANAQNSPGTALDTSLRAVVERKDVP